MYIVLIKVWIDKRNFLGYVNKEVININIDYFLFNIY